MKEVSFLKIKIKESNTKVILENVKIFNGKGKFNGVFLSGTLLKNVKLRMLLNRTTKKIRKEKKIFKKDSVLIAGWII